MEMPQAVDGFIIVFRQTLGVYRRHLTGVSLGAEIADEVVDLVTDEVAEINQSHDLRFVTAGDRAIED
jgi:hypothetical protein